MVAAFGSAKRNDMLVSSLGHANIAWHRTVVGGNHRSTCFDSLKYNFKKWFLLSQGRDLATNATLISSIGVYRSNRPRQQRRHLLPDASPICGGERSDINFHFAEQHSCWIDMWRQFIFDELIAFSRLQTHKEICVKQDCSCGYYLSSRE
ncbi:hypothetical protein M433DRAFT_142919 [Acidomyces richmondensis BFW]|nr:MAG: hypothetical protein FE78DRAFT_78681 [Acidomyces sp. 'richmondensis']KYG46505.1 hypothetical protein M433DRAFT_142919 [Acidomyces richmondensis BFW]